MPTESTIWDRLQSIDPRYLYIALILVIAAPLLNGYAVPGIPFAPARQAYNTVEQIADTNPHGFVLIAADWTASMRGESHWQNVAALRQIMRHHLRFALVSFDPQNRSLEQADIAAVNDEVYPGSSSGRYEYGRDYCIWGYKPGGAIPQFLKGIVQDVPGTVKVDYRGTPVSQLPCMNGIRTTADISLIEVITATSLLDGWLQFVVHDSKPPLVYFPTSVEAPEGYPFLQSHQIAGMVTGVKGAGDYEQLEHVRGFGQTISTALSLVYLLIIVLVIVGNVGYHAGRSHTAPKVRSADS